MQCTTLTLRYYELRASKILTKNIPYASLLRGPDTIVSSVRCCRQLWPALLHLDDTARDIHPTSELTLSIVLAIDP